MNNDTLEEVFQLLKTATQLERTPQHRIEAATKYYESVYLMRQVLAHTPRNDKSIPTRTLLEEKIEYYTAAAQRLYFDDSSTAPLPPPFIKTDSRSPLIDVADDVSVLTIPPNSIIIIQ